MITSHLGGKDTVSWETLLWRWRLPFPLANSLFGTSYLDFDLYIEEFPELNEVVHSAILHLVGIQIYVFFLFFSWWRTVNILRNCEEAWPLLDVVTMIWRLAKYCVMTESCQAYTCDTRVHHVQVGLKKYSIRNLYTGLH